MANNRMFLVSDRLGLRVTLAKYYPSGGWSVGNNDLVDDIGRALGAADMGGVSDWRIAYESDADFSYDHLAAP